MKEIDLRHTKIKEKTFYILENKNLKKFYVFSTPKKSNYLHH